MSRIKGSLKLSSNIEVQAGAPLDARSIVPLKTDLTAAGTFDYSYVGMLVVAQDEGKLYVLKAKPTTEAANWAEVSGGGAGLSDDYYTKNEVDTMLGEGYYTKENVDAMISSVYKPAGNATLATLPALEESVLGNVYNMTEDFTTTDDFAEGADKKYGVGANVVVVDISAEGEDPNYKFDVMPGFIDLSGYQTKIQVVALPEASEDEVGNIYQYIGSSTSELTKGYFYICQEVTPATDPKTYEWVAKTVQDASGSGALSRSINVTKAVGGISIGAVYNEGTSYDVLWQDLLNPIEYPSFTAPSASISATGAKLLEIGATLDTTITATFNRGSISPAYGTSGYRAGAAETYTLNGGTAQVSNKFNVTVDEDNKSFNVTVAYAEGEQPKDSAGNDYNSPLTAGTVISPTLNYEFVNALWSNTANITAISKEALVSASAKLKAFVFPAATIENPEVFDVPATWNITALEVLNTLSNTWEDCSGEFAITNTTHNDAAGVETAYKRYTCNLGYAMGTRNIRIKWS